MSIAVRDLGHIEYMAAWRIQESALKERADGVTCDTLLLLEHGHVFTLGRRGLRENLLDATDNYGEPIPVHVVTRGGDITYHGPGQLVGYPIFDLTARGGDVVRFLRDMERALCLAARALGVDADVNPPYTGIWSGGEKLASIGVAVRRGVTHHGFALNVSTDLAYFRKIVPCGLSWATMTSLERLLGRPVAVEDAKAAVTDAFRTVFVTPPTAPGGRGERPRP